MYYYMFFSGEVGKSFRMTESFGQFHRSILYFFKDKNPSLDLAVQVLYVLQHGDDFSAAIVMLSFCRMAH